MRNKISVIIVDKDYKYHDYSGIKYDDGGQYSEKRFELKILDTGVGIAEKLNKLRGFDVIITIGDESIWGDLCYMPFYVRKKWVHLNKFDANSISLSIIATFLQISVTTDI